MRYLALLIPLLVPTFAPAAPAAPKIEGKTVAQWLHMLRTDDLDQWKAATDVLTMNGDRLVTSLTAALEDKDARVRAGAARALRDLKAPPPGTIKALRQHLPDPSLGVRAEVIETLLYAHDYDAPLPEALRGLLAAPGTTGPESAADLFGLLPSDRQPYLDLLLAALRHGDPVVREQAVNALYYDRGTHVQIVEPLLKALKDPVPTVRVAAARAYWYATQDTPPVMGTLVDVLKAAPEATDRAAAADMIQQLGTRAKDLFEALAAVAVEDPEPKVRTAAASALAAVRPDPELAVPVYVRLMKERDGAGREGALQGLIDAGPAAATVLPELLPELIAAMAGDHIFSSLPRLAATAVGMIGPPARVAVPMLIRLANLPYDDSSADPAAAPNFDFSVSVNSDTQQAALAALAKVAPLPEALPYLLKALASKDESMVRTAADAIRLTGPAARTAVVPMIHAMITQDQGTYYPDLNEALFRALLSVDPKALPANLLKIAQKRPTALYELQWMAAEVSNPDDFVAPLVELAQNPPSEQAAAAAANLLAAFGVQKPEAAAALGRMLCTKANPGVHANVTDALRAMGPAALPAVPYLLKCLQSRDEFTRYLAIDVIEMIGPGAIPAAPRLLELLRNRKLSFVERLGAAYALKALDGDGKALVAPLLEMLDLPQARGGAAQLLGDLGPMATAAVPALRRILPEAKPYASVQIARAIWRLTGDTATILPLVEQVARGELGVGKIGAILLLGDLGPAAASQTSLLKELLDDKARTVVMGAAVALARITGDQSGLAASVLRALRNRTSDAEGSEFMLTPMLEPALRPFAASLVTPLVKALQETTDVNRQVELIAFLAGLGPAAKEAEPVLEVFAATGADINPGSAAQFALQTIRGRKPSAGFAGAMRLLGDDMPWKIPAQD
ncbi:MAG: HEAT repeat domain-containing protein [Armatimonadia bacterium]